VCAWGELGGITPSTIGALVSDLYDNRFFGDLVVAITRLDSNDLVAMAVAKA
jgi:hypothetical protein